MNFSQLLLISTFVLLQDSLKFILDSYRFKYGHSFPTETSELHSTRFKSWKFQLIPALIEKYIYIRSRSIWLHFLFHVYSDKIDQILDDAETTESMVNQILYRTFLYQKCHDKALLPTGAEVTIPFMYWLLETWSEWGKAETGKKSTTNCDWKKKSCKPKGLNNVLRMFMTTLFYQANPCEGCTFI